MTEEKISLKLNIIFMNNILRLKREGKMVEKKQFMGRSCPLATKFWWSPSKVVVCLYLVEFVTWKEVPECKKQVWDG